LAFLYVGVVPGGPVTVVPVTGAPAFHVNGGHFADDHCGGTVIAGWVVVDRRRVERKNRRTKINAEVRAMPMSVVVMG
jgi:hypothetical protein